MKRTIGKTVLIPSVTSIVENTHKYLHLPEFLHTSPFSTRPALPILHPLTQPVSYETSHSDNMSPPNTRRQHSQVRFLDSDTYISPPSYSPSRHGLPPTMATPNSHTYPRDRNGSWPTERVNPTAPVTSPAPVFNNPFVTQHSPAVDTDDLHTVDISDRNNYDDVGNNGYASISRVSAVPFAPNQRPQAADHWDPQAYYSPQTRAPVEEASQDNDDRRGSDETLTDYSASSAYSRKDKDDAYGPPRPSDYDPPQQRYNSPRSNPAHSANNNAARRSSRQHDIENQSSDFDVSAGNNPGMTDEEHAKLRHGFFNHVKDSLNHLTRDSDAALLDSERNTRHPSLADSRRNSWSGKQSAQKSDGPPAGRSRSQSMSYPENQRDNFERSMAFNEDYDETYLLDDEGRHRSVREAVFNNPRLRVQPKNRPSPEFSGEGQRKSYSERRKREKHRIIHCAERKYSVFLMFRIMSNAHVQPPRSTRSSSSHSRKLYSPSALHPIVSRPNSTRSLKSSSWKHNSNTRLARSKSPSAIPRHAPQKPV